MTYIRKFLISSINSGVYQLLLSADLGAIRRGAFESAACGMVADCGSAPSTLGLTAIA